MTESALARSAFGLYRVAGHIASPLVRGHLMLRAQRGREDKSRLPERLGKSQRPRPPGPLLWLHAASVGEALSTLILIERIAAERPDLTVLMTTGTVTSARLMAERLPARVIHQFAPVDLPSAVAAFLDHWQPNLTVFVESELWPTLVTAIRQRAIPSILLNARLSRRSARGWQLLRPVIDKLLSGFDLVLAQSPQDRDRLINLGAANAQYVGNLKSAAPSPGADEDALEKLGARLGERPRWLAASTHPGEEVIVAEAHRHIRMTHPDALCLIVPRHPARGREINRTLKRSGRQVGAFSEGALPEPTQEIYIADSLGELGLWYRLSPIVFVGGSLLPVGGHNLLEPAKLGCTILTGPYTENFAQIAKDMKQQGALIPVVSHVDIYQAVVKLLSEPEEQARLGQAARDYSANEADVLTAVLSAMAPFLDRLAPSSGAAPN